MQKCQEKFKRIEELQNKYAKQLSDYDSNNISLMNTSKPINILDSNKTSLKLSNFTVGNEQRIKMLNDIDNITRSINDNAISSNYINLCSFIMQGPPPPSYKSQTMKPQSSNRGNPSHHPKPQQPMIDNTQAHNHNLNHIKEKSFKHSNSDLIKPKVIISMNKDIVSSIDWKENQRAKDLIMKKQNVFLSNELINLKVKMGKINNKNIMLVNMIKSQEQVKNFKVLDKFIESFIEKLAINWNEIVDLTIDELLENEVLELNAMELQKINYEELRKTTFADIMKNCTYSNIKGNANTNSKFNIMFESMDEIKDMISRAKNAEASISKKYNIK